MSEEQGQRARCGCCEEFLGPEHRPSKGRLEEARVALLRARRRLGLYEETAEAVSAQLLALREIST